MIIASWNINGINKRLDQLFRFLDDRSPDVVCLQELKCEHSQFPETEIADAGYDAVWHGEGRWNGVAILSKGNEMTLIRDALPGDPADAQARYLEVAIHGRILACVYAPNGNPAPGPKFDYKLAWLRRLKSHCQSFNDYHAPAILAGDFNVVQSDTDIYETSSYDENAMLAPNAREALSDVLATGFIDAQADMHAGSSGYTFWDYRRNRWQRNAGLRLDLVLLNQLAKTGLSSVSVYREARSWTDPSDHAPIVVKL